VRLGVLGGTFDPVHVGHLVIANEVRHTLSLDKVLLVVANVPWQKVGRREISPAADRLALVEAAAADVEGLEASSIEIDRGGWSYMVDTAEQLHAEHDDLDLHLIVGTDVADDLETWERVDDLRRLVTLVVVGRPGAERPTAEQLTGWRVEHLEVPALDISSTDLRARFADGRPVDFLIPAAAVHHAKERGMYGARG
jgi:nicotinate-nucleotide adenylyltransferase